MKKIILILFSLLSFAAYSQNYTTTGSLNVARWEHQSQLLYNKKVLVFGGDNGYLFPALVYTSAELYNPATGTWSYTGSMKKKRTEFTSVVLPNGNVLAIGGLMHWDGSELFSTASCEIYNVASGTWSYTDSMKVDRTGHKAILLRNGKILVAGGSNGETCELYDPSKNKWSYTGSTSTSMKRGMDLIMLQDGKVLATLGVTAEIYDPLTGIWSTVNNTLHGVRTFHNSVLLPDGRVLLAGSSEPSDQNTAELFDPITQIFTATGSMSEYRAASPMVLMDNGKVLIYGIGDFFTPTDTKTIEVYDPATGIWTTDVYTQIGAQSYRIQKMADGTFLVSGGSWTTLNGATRTCVLINQDILGCNTPNLSLAFTGNTSCVGKTSQLTLSNSQSGLSYNLYLGSTDFGNILGNGGDVIFNVPGSSITNGNTLFSLRVKEPGCPSLLLNDTAIINASYLTTPTITPSGANTICSGDSLLLIATAGYTNYQWTNNSTEQQIYIKTAGNYSVIVSASDGCSSDYSTPASLALHPPLTPSVNIVVNANPFNVGDMITFTANATNPGNTPIYQWTINEIPTGTNSSTFSSNSINHGDKVKCFMTSNALCPTVVDVASNELTMINSAMAIPPTITSFAPLSGSAGSTLIINGTNFSTVLSENTVYFGAAKATVSAASSTALTVMIPSGATYAPITVTTTSTYTATSTQSFNLTFCAGDFQAASFTEAIQYEAPQASPYKTLLADLDSDSKSDIIFIEYNNRKISVYKNTSSIGSISLAAKAVFSLTNGPRDFAIGDIDGDGKLDLAIVTEPNNVVSVYKNTSTPGTISFATVVNFPTGIFPSGISINDINGDGKPELIVINQNDNNISILKNTSTGGTISFATRINFSTGTRPMFVSSSDLNNDTKPDLVICNVSSKTISILRNTSTLSAISFAAKIDYATGDDPKGLTLGDLNKDGKPDIALVNSTSKTISIYKNTNSGSAISFTPKTDISTIASPHNVSIGNMDGDGNPDLVVSMNNNTVVLFRNISFTPLISFDKKQEYSLTGNTPYGVALGDIDGDSKPDIIASCIPSSGYNKIVLLLNQIGNKVVMSSPSMASVFTGETASIAFSSTGISSYNWIAADNPYTTGESLTNQSSDTLINTIVNNTIFDQTVTYTVTPIYGFCNVLPQTVSIIVKALPPSITTVSTINAASGTPVTITGTNFSSSISDNIVHFGSIKAIITSASQTSLTVIVPMGTSYDFIKVTVNKNICKSPYPFITTFDCGGPINSKTLLRNENKNSGSMYSTSISNDLDGDGYMDLITVNTTAGNISILRNITSGAIIDFAAKTDYATVSSPNGIYSEDLNGDGKPDLVVGGQNSNFTILQNTSVAGSISFAPSQDVLCPGTSKILLNDIDGDGKMDVITLGTISHENNIRIFKNTSTSTFISFATAILLPTSVNPSNIITGDVDGDFKPDIIGITSQDWDSRIVIFKNTSTKDLISFGSSTNIVTSSSLRKIAIGDLDGDLKPELITISNTFNIYKNNSTTGTISFANNNISYTSLPVNISIGDINGDGKPDLITAEGAQNSVTIYKNTSTTGTISFPSKILLSTGTTTTNILVQDFNSDGKPDIMAANSPSFFIYENHSEEFMLTNPGEYSIASGSTLAISLTSDLPRDYSWSATDNNNVSGESLSWEISGVINNTLVNSSYEDQTIDYSIISTSLSGSCPSVTDTIRVLVLAPFYITSLAPSSALIGATITINGSGFDPSPANNIVYFGKVKAVILAAQTTQLTVIVPPGASYDLVSVTRSGRICYSALPFIVMHNCSGILDTSSFAPQHTVSVANPLSSYYGDIDEDGKIDVLIIRSGIISIFRNTTTGNYISLSPTPIDLTSCTNVREMRVVDVNQDGKLDLVTACYYPDYYFSVYINKSSPGNISFEPRDNIATPGYLRGISVLDLDGDNKQDIVTDNGRTYRNIGTQNTIQFTVGPAVPLGTTMQAADLDNDGKPDVVGFEYSEWDIKVFRNTSTPGNISFDSQFNIPKGNIIESFLLIDINNDHLLDIVTNNFGGGGTFQIFQNNSTPGNLSFLPIQDFDFDVDSESIGASDLDNDGKIDIIIRSGSSYYTSIYTIYKNTSTLSTLSFEQIKYKDPNIESNKMAAADLDGDGKTDLIVPSPSADNFRIFKNQASPITITNNNNYSACGNIINLNLTSAGASSFSWYAIDNPNTSGETTSTQTGSLINNTITTNTLPQTIDYHITSSNGTCSSDKIISVKFNPAPDISVSATNATICLGESSLISVDESNLQYYYIKNQSHQILSNPYVWPQTTETYTVIAKGTNTCIDSSFITITVNNCSPTALENMQEENISLSIYPNPVASILNIKYSSFSLNSIAKIYNINGHLLKTIELSSKETAVKADDLSAGIYFIKLINEDESVFYKFIKE